MPLTKETIFTMKKGVDVPDRFDGATVPIMAPANNAEMLELAGENAYIVFNRSYVLEVQKEIKDESQEEGASVETLREYSRNRKFGQPRVRGQGAARIAKPKDVEAVLGSDFLAMLTPAQRALYDAKMAEQTKKVEDAAKAKQAEKKAPAAATPTPAPAAPPARTATKK
jgi:hypothetical protein